MDIIQCSNQDLHRSQLLQFLVRVIHVLTCTGTILALFPALCHERCFRGMH